MLPEKRKGAKSAKEIPAEILCQLNSGKIETANLVEWLAVDQKILLKNLLWKLEKPHYLEPILLDVKNLKKQTVNTVNQTIGIGLFVQMEIHNEYYLLDKISNHNSDLVRCWAIYIISQKHKKVEELFEKIKPFANDTHFSVREISWLAIRSMIIENLAESITILSDWAKDENENSRRFASEATRPRGVWSEHIEDLKKNPELALPLLEFLKSDPSKYVQNSLANWLNDAGKTRSDFVIALTNKWKLESKTKETEFIIKRALRNIKS